MLASQVKARRRARIKCLVRYSGSEKPFCKCCGETEVAFLTLDHTNGGGRAHQKALNTKGTSFFHRLVKLGFPDGIQVLCFNCNCGRRVNGGICPHQQAKE